MDRPWNCLPGNGFFLLMPVEKPNFLDPTQQRQTALSRWDNEGGAGFHRPQEGLISREAQSEVTQLKNAEVVQLRILVIALENLVIALLAEASDRQLDLAREMAVYISPRPGFTPHPLTIHAAGQMIELVERAGRFRVPEGGFQPIRTPASIFKHPIHPMRADST